LCLRFRGTTWMHIRARFDGAFDWHVVETAHSGSGMLYGITVDRAAHPTHWMNGVSEQSPSDPRQAIEQQYRQRAEHYRAEREQLRRLDFWYSIARGAIFLLGLALAIGLLTDPRFGWG